MVLCIHKDGTKKVLLLPCIYKKEFQKKKKVILVAQSIMDGGEWLSVDHLNPLVVIYGETLRLIVFVGLKVSFGTVYFVKNWKHCNKSNFDSLIYNGWGWMIECRPPKHFGSHLWWDTEINSFCRIIYFDIDYFIKN